MEPEPSLEAEPKVPPEPETRKKMPETAPELAILKGAADDPARMVGVVVSIKRRQRARERGAREFAKEAAQAAAPPPKPRPPAPKGEAALRPLERILDRLSGVAATARRASEDPFCNFRARCKVVARAALDARLDARKELDTVVTCAEILRHRRDVVT